MFQLRLCFAFLLSGLILPGCVLAPLVQSFHEIGATKSARAELLQQEVKDMTDAFAWGKDNLVMQAVAPEFRDEMKVYLRGLRTKGTRVVEVKVESFDLAEDGFNAELEVRVRSYQAPYYVINDRYETQQWNFSFSNGWKLTSRTESPASA